MGLGWGGTFSATEQNVGDQQAYCFIMLRHTSILTFRQWKRSLSTTTAARSSNPHHYDYLVIGAGSGGMASARRAADLHGKKVGIIERGPLGGTCVNVGCVPKKIMWTAAELGQSLQLAKDYGHNNVTNSDEASFDWSRLKSTRDAYLLRLNGIYQRNLENSNVDVHYGSAKFVAPTPGADGGAATVQVGDSLLTADHVLIATGGYPVVPDVPGATGCLEGEEIGITSDGFFELQEQPKRVAIVGAGYIAVELAGVMAGLGSEVSLYIRGNEVLRSFDEIISTTITNELEKSGVQVHRYSNLARVERSLEGGLIDVTIESDQVSRIDRGFDEIVYAIGRAPAVNNLGLEHLPGVTLNGQGHVTNDQMSFTDQPNVYALGDVCGFWELTPVAIAAGRRLSDNLFGGPKHGNACIDYEKIPTVIFSHPVVGTIGMSENEAREKYGGEDVKCYTSTFVNLHYSMMDVEPSEKPRSHIKMVCRKSTNEEVVGLHIVGMGADEMLQGFGVAMKMGATKADFDSSIAIHPTAAEEVVTLAPWGWSEE